MGGERVDSDPVVRGAVVVPESTVRRGRANVVTAKVAKVVGKKLRSHQSRMTNWLVCTPHARWCCGI